MRKVNAKTLPKMQEMDLLDFFAAKALPIVYKKWFEQEEQILVFADDEALKLIAFKSYEMAEAMMDAKNMFYLMD